MAIGQTLERMDDRLDAIETSLIQVLQTRVISRDLKHYTEQTDADLTAGVVTIVSSGEKDYSKDLGMAARDGTQSVLLVGHLRIAEGMGGKAVEAAELDLIEEIKAWMRAGVTGMSLHLNNVQHSRQLDNPYGWIVAYVDAGPPSQTTY